MGLSAAYAGKKYLKKSQNRASFGSVPARLREARVKVARRKRLGRYSGKTFKLTTLANRFGVSLRRGRGWKRATTIVKETEKRMEKNFLAKR